MPERETELHQPDGAAPTIASPEDIDPAFADRAFAGTSWTPERRGYLYRDEYANAVNGLYAEFWPLAKTEEQRSLLAGEMERYRQGYLQRMKAYLASHGNVVSSFIAGPSKFPAARMQKRGRWADNKLNDLVEWDKRARAAIRKSLLDARPPEAKEEAEWTALRREIAGSLTMVSRIDKDGAPYNRPAFTNSIAGRIERLAKNGEVALVERALAWLDEHNLDSGKPTFTKRHKVWTFADVASEAAQKLEARAGKASELIAEAPGIELWADYQLDRAQLIFPDKPSHEMREKLKRSGWKWSPTNGAWQRQLTDSALHSGRSILSGMTPAPDREREMESEGPAR
jgi:hypothetical protein